MKVRSRAKAEIGSKPPSLDAAKVAADSMLASIAYDERKRSGAPPDAEPTDVAVLAACAGARHGHGDGEPLRCREPRCRRTRRCVGPTMRCSRRDVAAPPSTPEKDAKLMEMYREALQARRGSWASREQICATLTPCETIAHRAAAAASLAAPALAQKRTGTAPCRQGALALIVHARRQGRQVGRLQARLRGGDADLRAGGEGARHHAVAPRGAAASSRSPCSTPSRRARSTRRCSCAPATMFAASCAPG